MNSQNPLQIPVQVQRKGQTSYQKIQTGKDKTYTGKNRGKKEKGSGIKSSCSFPFGIIVVAKTAEAST